MKDPEYELGSFVFHRCADEREQGMVLAVTYHLDSKRPTYLVGWGDHSQSEHYEAELSDKYEKMFES